jgi:hypothetical protein
VTWWTFTAEQADERNGDPTFELSAQGDPQAVAQVLRTLADHLAPVPAGPRVLQPEGLLGDTAAAAKLRQQLAARGADVERLTQMLAARNADVERIANRLAARDADHERLTRVIDERNAEIGRLLHLARGRAVENAPAAHLSATESAEQVRVDGEGPPEPQNGSQGEENTDGKPYATIGLRVLRVIDAARAWRDENLSTVERIAANDELRAAVSGLSGAYQRIDTHVVLAASREKGWRAGVRWAAAEADAQARAHGLANTMIDFTDHLRLCASDPDRPAVVDRNRAPAVHDPGSE